MTIPQGNRGQLSSTSRGGPRPAGVGGLEIASGGGKNERGSPAFGWGKWAGTLCIVAATLLTYSRTLSDPFIYDDIAAIPLNPTIRTVWTALSPPLKTTVTGRPILNLTFAANYGIGGTAVRGYHVLNLVIHVLGAIILFGIFRRSLARASVSKAAPVAFSGALIWALHPLQTESVTYIAQRAESLMGLFYLLTLYCFIRAVSADGPRRNLWQSLSVASCFLGMGTKEVMVSAPLTVLLFDRAFFAGTFRNALRDRRTYYCGLASTWIFLVALVLSTGGNRGSSTTGLGTGVAWFSYLWTQFPAVCDYLRLSVWPYPLVFEYGTFWITNPIAVLPEALFVGLLAAASVWALVRSPRLGFLGYVFFAILAPTSLVPGAIQMIAEHRMYLALAPIAILIAIGFHRIPSMFGPYASILFAVGLGVATWQRNEAYRSEESIWTDTVNKRPKNYRAHNALGEILSVRPGRQSDAVRQYELALRIKPDYVDALNNLGNLEQNVPDRIGQSIHHLEDAIGINPRLSTAHNNLANALSKVPGRERDAEKQYEDAIRLEPGYAEAQYNLGNLLSRVFGRASEAAGHYETALRLDPSSVAAHYNFGLLLSSMPGRKEDAIEQYEECIRREPRFAEAHLKLGNALLAVPGRINDAEGEFEEAIRIKPDYAEAHSNLGIALSNFMKRWPEAESHYLEALRIDPNLTEAHYNLGNLYLRMPGRLAEAVVQYRRVLTVFPNSIPAHYNMAFALLKIPGSEAEARSHLEAILRIEPENQRAKRLLGAVAAAGPQ